MKKFREATYLVIKDRQEKHAGANIHNVCGKLSIVLNGCRNYEYWINQESEIMVKSQNLKKQAADCEANIKEALKYLGEADQFDMLFEEVEDPWDK
jgi:hypothetical protein